VSGPAGVSKKAHSGKGRPEPATGSVLVAVAIEYLPSGPDRPAAGGCVATIAQRDLESTWERVPRPHFGSTAAAEVAAVAS